MTKLNLDLREHVSVSFINNVLFFCPRGVDSADRCVSPGPPDSTQNADADRQSEGAANPRGEVNSPSCIFTALREYDVLHNSVKV